MSCKLLQVYDFVKTAAPWHKVRPLDASQHLLTGNCACKLHLCHGQVIDYKPIIVEYSLIEKGLEFQHEPGLEHPTYQHHLFACR